jgi:hypothetical protein
MAYDATRSSWYSMLGRCFRESCPGYKDYGGRGIGVCDAWVASYESFLRDVGDKPGKGYSLDRIDVNGNYEPGNVRWATTKEQNRNTRANRLITWEGRTLCVSEWAEATGLPSYTIRNRLGAGLPLSEVFAPSKRKPRRAPSEHKTPEKRSPPERTAWKAMLYRCFNPQHHAYKNYGGRGISVCDRWVESYQNFLDDMGSRPSPDHSLDRINVQGNYEPGNCRWSTRDVQQQNRTTTKYLIVDGKRMSYREAMGTLGISYECLLSRVRRGVYPHPPY